MIQKRVLNSIYPGLHNYDNVYGITQSQIPEENNR